MDSISQLLRYSEKANELVMAEVVRLSDEQLDRPLDLGMGSLRKILQHILAGEVTWLERMRGNVEAKWPARPIPSAVAEMRDDLRATSATAREWLSNITPDQLTRIQQYRDSRGSLFQATLHEMLLQMLVHSTHHRAQAVNAIRRLGGTPPEVDFMSAVRQPAR